MLYVCLRDVMDVVFSACIVRRGLVEALNATFCVTCNLLMLVVDARGDHMEELFCLDLV